MHKNYNTAPLKLGCNRSRERAFLMHIQLKQLLVRMKQI